MSDRIVALNDGVVRYLRLLGIPVSVDNLVEGGGLVGVGHQVTLPETGELPKVSGEPWTNPTGSERFSCFLTASKLSIDALKRVKADTLVSSLPLPPIEPPASPTSRLPSLSEELSQIVGAPIRVLNVYPRTLSELYEEVERLGRVLRKEAAALDRVQRWRAQLLDWSSNFYDRTRNKRFACVSALEPLTLAGNWVSDIARLSAAHPIETGRVAASLPYFWSSLELDNPDVLLIALRTGESLGSRLALLESLPFWEKLSCVKRGEVVFVPDETIFTVPCPDLTLAAGIVISALAGLDSGYIVPRDSFYRLRWLELHRHRI